VLGKGLGTISSLSPGRIVEINFLTVSPVVVFVKSVGSFKYTWLVIFVGVVILI
jgi:hypothetical protein